ncbi:MAG TPA: FAD-binding oxidoreductase [Xanthobacteraceae bacterium]|nr:FAD-binding oxidoreductase [Xanthobacteraceae bacterium]
MGRGDSAISSTSWYEATRVVDEARGTLNIDLDVDVCVIGGGLAGLTAAREIARRGWSVVLLEARRIAWNASGRNTGFVLPGFAADPEAVIARVGLEQAKALWTLSQAGFDYVRTAAREMPGVEVSEGGWLNVAKFDNDEEEKKSAEQLAGDFGVAVEFWPPERVREVLKSPLYFGGLHYPNAFSIHPLNYALGLAAAAEAAGARIFEDTPAVEIDPQGVRKRVVTPNGRVRSAHLVLAGNVHLKRVMPKIAGTLLPISVYVLTTAPLGERLKEAITYPGAVSDTKLADNHYRVVGGDRLMWSGRSTVWQGNPRRYARPLVEDIKRAYPQLGEVQVDYVWTGTLGNTVHRMPQIGELMPGCWLVSGFGGHGINTTAMGGELIARAIVDGDGTWRQFIPFELVWAGGLLGRAAMQVYYWTYRRREQLRAHLSRQRRRKTEIAAQRAAADTPQTVASGGKS